MELGYFDPETGTEYAGPAAPAALVTPRDYSLANTLITGIADMTKSILGLVVVAKTSDAQRAPGVPGFTPVVLPGQGMSTPGMLMIALPLALVALLVLKKD
jgi:hypothetical protein